MPPSNSLTSSGVDSFVLQNAASFTAGRLPALPSIGSSQPRILAKTWIFVDRHPQRTKTSQLDQSKGHAENVNRGRTKRMTASCFYADILTPDVYDGR